MKLLKYILFLLLLCMQQPAFACWDDEDDELSEFVIEDEEDDYDDDEYWEDYENDDDFPDDYGSDWWEDDDYDEDSNEDSDDWWFPDDWPSFDDTFDDTDDVEYENWNDDDEYPNMLDEIYVYPDHEDDTIGAYDFAYEFHLIGSYDNDDTSWDDNDDTSDDDKETTDNPDDKNDSTEYYKFDDKDKVIKYKFPKNWAKQYTRMGCVLRVMSMAFSIFFNHEDDKIDEMFSDNYILKTGIDPFVDGVESDSIGKFIESEFDSYQVDSEQGIKTAIDDNNSVLGTVKNSEGYHEVLIIGYTERDDKENENNEENEDNKGNEDNPVNEDDKKEGDFIYIDPGTGDYGRGNYEDFYFKKYAVKGVK
ncbi:MAG: hypothetical protein J6B91_03855 [Prevotella sp.]|nr:hypothetical protein [Prevotella sp.]